MSGKERNKTFASLVLIISCYAADCGDGQQRVLLGIEVAARKPGPIKIASSLMCSLSCKVNSCRQTSAFRYRYQLQMGPGYIIDWRSGVNEVNTTISSPRADGEGLATGSPTDALAKGRMFTRGNE